MTREGLIGVMEEALSCYYSRIVAPVRDCSKDNIALRTMDHLGIVREPLPRHSMKETRELIKLLKYHFRRDRNGGVQRITSKLSRIHGLAIRKRQIIIRTLGETLGEAIYNRYGEGSVTRPDLIELLSRKYEKKGESLKVYNCWLRRVKPFRGGWRVSASG